jgi:hypothetical protein
MWTPPIPARSRLPRLPAGLTAPAAGIKNQEELAMKTLARVIATTAAVAALSTLVLTIPAAAGVPAPGE